MAHRATQLYNLHVNTYIYVFIREQYQNDVVYMPTQPIISRGLRSSGILRSDRYLWTIKQPKHCLSPEDGTDRLPRNVDNILPIYAALNPRWVQISFAPVRKSQITHIAWFLAQIQRSKIHIIETFCRLLWVIVVGQRTKSLSAVSCWFYCNGLSISSFRH